jgi:dTDP-4-dehydrorhamnose reductase
MDITVPTSASPARVLVLGATGQLGAQLVAQLGAAALPAARRPQAPDWLHLDLESIAANPAHLDVLIDKHNITAVFCAAGATNVDKCETDHDWAAAANHLGPLALARAARHIPFVFFSTDYVFDGSAENPGPYAEDANTNPLSIYGRTKLEGEQSILAAHPSALVLRTTTVYGPDPQGKNYLYTLSRVLKAGNTMLAPTDQLATPTYNADLAAASIALVQRKQTGIFHIAGPDFLSRYDFALAACKILALPTATLKPITTPELAQAAGRPLLGGLDISKLQSALGPTCMRPAETGIRDWQASLGKATA